MGLPGKRNTVNQSSRAYRARSVTLRYEMFFRVPLEGPPKTDKLLIKILNIYSKTHLSKQVYILGNYIQTIFGRPISKVAVILMQCHY